MGQQVNVGRELHFEPGAIVTGSWNGSFDRGGTTYYVNNIHGSSTADGLSWNSAVDQVSTAITLSEASRLVHLGTTTNNYIRNTIVIQGTATEYTGALTDLGEFVNIIGLSTSDQLTGMDLGVVRIGTSTTSGAEVAAMMRGVRLQNLLFLCGGSSTYGLRVIGNSLSCHIYGCGFQNTAASATSLMQFDALCANGIIEYCQFSNQSTSPTYAFKVVGQHSDMRVRHNGFLCGGTAAVTLGAASWQINTIYSENFFSNSPIGFQDQSTDGYAILAHNYFGSDVADPSERVNHTRSIMNYTASGTDTLISS